ncbi:unnamed protein product [Arctia plantaginis]|uniref:Uncharacterized protein n=1 Tax=Arctia plantaginis TaxID=874455 RepID=A0A8S1AWA0_ARCPL|nr:unnamed protein product [Arctia plantaginis]
MSVLRSPTGCGSLTNLSNVDSPDFSEERNVAKRNKRKRSEDLSNEIVEMRKEMGQMLTLMKSVDSNQKQFMERITADMTSIKEQMCDIKSTISAITTEQVAMKSDITTLQNKENTLQKFIDNMQLKVEKLTSAGSQPVKTMREISQKEKKKSEDEKKKECEQRRRDKIKTDPVAYEAAKATESERWQKRRAEKKVKTIKDMTPREQRTQRAIWRKEYRDKQQFKKRQEIAMRIATENSPPTTDDECIQANVQNLDHL